jgi:hypothetical protein
MIMLNERHHAFLSATFYRLMKEDRLPGFRDVFLFATRKYGEQRGSRMAQRAIRDGKPLSFPAYRYYGEWEFTEECLAGAPDPMYEDVDDGDNHTKKIFHCPWSQTYLALDQLEGANEYCSVLDISIARGFNPDLVFEARKTMHAQGDYCYQVQKDGLKSDGCEYGPKNPENLRDFNYHCAHLYKTFRDIVSAIYKSAGVALASKVLTCFVDAYGKEAADRITAGLGIDFDYID